MSRPRMFTIAKDGQIVRYVATTDDMIALNVAEDETFLPGNYDADAFYLADGAALPRPRAGGPLPASKALTLNEDWLVPDVPAGTLVFVDADVMGEVEADGLVLCFPMPGVWTVEIRPPFPWIGGTCEVTVT